MAPKSSFAHFTPNSGDTGGIVQDDWQTVNWDKQNYLTPIEFPLSGNGGEGTTPTATPTTQPTQPPPTTMPTATPTQTVPNSLTFALANTNVSPQTGSSGTNFNLNVGIKANANSSVLVDLEIYDANNSKTFQSFRPYQSFVAGQTKNFNFNWASPITLNSGQYAVSVGIFANDWSKIYFWQSNIGTITINGNQTQLTPPTPTPSPTATPTPRPTPTSGNGGNGSLPSGWYSTDIGQPSLAGYASFNSANNSFAVTGSGQDIWNNFDQFHFVYHTFSGDGQFVARVASEQNTDNWAKAGIMIRQSLDANSPYVDLVVTPNSGVSFQYRKSFGGDSDHQDAGGKTPEYVKIVRQGSTFSSYVSTDAANWTLVGTATVPLSQQVLVGFAVTSRNTGETNTAIFDNITGQ